LPNGCFIESVAALRDRLARGSETMRPQLLTYYLNTPLGLAGHTVLTFQTRAGIEVIDPEVSAAPRQYPRSLADDALALACAVSDRAVVRARQTSLEGMATAVQTFASRFSPGDAVTIQ